MSDCENVRKPSPDWFSDRCSPSLCVSDQKVNPLLLADIAHHIDLAAHFAAGFDYDTFRADLRTVYAVTRCLEIISEASRRLPDEMKARHPAIAWKDMAGAGNIYRHDYEDVAAQHVWEAVQIDLPPLRVVIERELAGLG
jgi:uncharacterized protein with HEPN domain